MNARAFPQAGHVHAMSVRGQRREQRRVWWRVYVTTLFLTLVFGGLAFATAPKPLSLTLAAYFATAVWIVARPSVGVYLITFLTLLGDSVVSPWYPFTKNMSSRESISFVHDALSITPIELVLAITTLAWLLQSYAMHSLHVRRGALMWPTSLFGCFVAMGLARGLIAGGDVRIAVFEARALFYLPILYFLIVQLFTTRAQYVRLWIVAIVAIFGQSLIAIEYFSGLELEQRTGLESLTEHSASIHLAALFIVLIASWLIPGTSLRLRFAVLMVSVPWVVVFGLSERRSAVVALAAGVLLLLIVLAATRPATLIWLLPVIAVSTVGYLAIFWNASGPIGFGAQAIKSVIAPEQLARVDQSSDIYRRLEAFDLWFTIRAQPITGVGFGNPFYQPWRLPYLPGFEFRYFIPHNSILWIWLKLGVAGFVTMLFMFGRAIQYGARNVVRLASGDQAALMMGSVAYVAMFSIFAYVDIAWDARSTVFLAVAMAWCADFTAAGGGDQIPTDAASNSADLISPGRVDEGPNPDAPRLSVTGAGGGNSTRLIVDRPRAPE
jgi:O-antigen ligase